MNVLLTSVGRRAYIVKYFKEILGESGKVHVCNSDNKSIAFKYADKKVISPLIYDNNYIDFLLSYCKNNKIDILISLFDIDLLVLAKNKVLFENIGTKVIVSDQKIIEICNDKWLTNQFLCENGFNTPKTYLNIQDVKDKIRLGEINYPIVVKPRFGCGSISISIAYDEEDLNYLTKKINKEIDKTYLKFESSVTNMKVIYQEYLNGQEYGVDIINDLDGNTRNVIIRKKIAMRSGETDIAEIVHDEHIYNELMKLGKCTRHIANMDCDVFIANNKLYILEMNARFGGGYPFSHLAGCNLPYAITRWVKGKEVDDDILFAKYGTLGFKEIYITKYEKDR